MFKQCLLVVVIFSLNAVFGRNDATSKIIKGTQVGGSHNQDGKMVNVRSSKQYPYMVEIEFHGLHWCGGAIVKSDVVLTAAHCFKTKNTDGYFVRAGHVYRNSQKAPALQTSSLAKIIPHPKYIKKQIGNDDVTYHDLAFVKLVTPFKFDEYIHSINLPMGDDLNEYANEKAVTLGWGTTEGNSYSPILLKLNVRILDQDECEKRVTRYHKSYLCAEGINKKGTIAGGDSGGPLVKHYHNPQKDVLLGVNSFSFMKRHPVFKDQYVSDESSPFITTNIAFYSKFVKEVLTKL